MNIATSSPAMQQTVAANAPPAFEHAPLAGAIEIPAAPQMVEPVDIGDDFVAAPGVFNDLLRAARPSVAANDAIGADDLQPTHVAGQKRKARTTENAVFESRSEMALRRVVGPRLVRAREACGLGQREAALEIGYQTPAQLSLWESGRRFPPASELLKVAALYRTTVSFLLGEAAEMNRDPAAGLRAAMLNGVRLQLTRCVEVICGEVNRHAKLVGTDSGSTATFIAAGTELLDAVQALIRLNRSAFDDLRGGAAVELRVESFEQALHEATRRQRLAQALDADLRERLGRLPEGDIDIGPEGDEA